MKKEIPIKKNGYRPKDAILRVVNLYILKKYITMPTFSKTSKERLLTCHKDIQTLMNEVIKITNITILCGHREQIEQDKAFREGKSKFKWPKSKHNTNPSKAIDIAPYPINWDDVDGFIELSTIVKNTWYDLKSSGKVTETLYWGGDWRTFKDMPHYEL